MKKDCVFCYPELEKRQRVILENEFCMFLRLEQAEIKGSQLEGAGLIVPKIHRETVFDLTSEEWNGHFELLRDVKDYLDKKHQPEGYNLGWNSEAVGGQHIFHAHFHVIPRYKDEPLSGKGIRYLFKSEENKRNHFYL
ncbi:HIT family protein [Virgibacillus profundi]|uniref:HIT family protein n=1 Tax=Virgibacillus profundi TaxID=2024555 RepID=A0A2A2IBV5_9BACI|nr:HIT family protein [Virgibacillus profundi]PAV28858.1 HIT family protein [Virgibacillus profundi]PXY53026.1 HIT family protein [Virgibacillus profundi]